MSYKSWEGQIVAGPYEVTCDTPDDYDSPTKIAIAMQNVLNTLDPDELINVLERDGTFYFIHKKREPKPTKVVKSRNR